MLIFQLLRKNTWLITDPVCCNNKRMHFNILANNSLNLFISELYVSSLFWILCRKTLTLLISYLVLRTYSCLFSHCPWSNYNLVFLTVCSVPSECEYKQYTSNNIGKYFCYYKLLCPKKKRCHNLFK